MRAVEITMVNPMLAPFLLIAQPINISFSFSDNKCLCKMIIAAYVGFPLLPYRRIRQIFQRLTALLTLAERNQNLTKEAVSSLSKKSSVHDARLAWVD